MFYFVSLIISIVDDFFVSFIIVITVIWKICWVLYIFLTSSWIVKAHKHILFKEKLFSLFPFLHLLHGIDQVFQNNAE